MLSSEQHPYDASVPIPLDHKAPPSPKRTSAAQPTQKASVRISTLYTPSFGSKYDRAFDLEPLNSPESAVNLDAKLQVSERETDVRKSLRCGLRSLLLVAVVGAIHRRAADARISRETSALDAAERRFHRDLFYVRNVACLLP